MDSFAFEHILQKNNLVLPYDRIIVGVSGGPDSMALLHLFCQCGLDITVIAVYVDHGLRPQESSKEQAVVRQVAQQYLLDYEIIGVDAKEHKKGSGCSLEESCRVLRYKALEECRHQYDAHTIAVAHTADDQAEEILLRLFRGTGLKGLSGMAMKNANIIRPLLTTSKSTLLGYLQSSNIDYCIDSSNADRAMLRNRLRLDLLPLIKRNFNPSLQATLLQTSEILREEDRLLDDILQQKFSTCCHVAKNSRTHFSIELHLAPFLNEHIAMQRRMVENAIHHFSIRPHFRHINDVLSMACSTTTATELHLPQGLRVVRWRDVIWFFQPHGRTPFRGSTHFRPPLDMEVQCDGDYLLEAIGIKIHLQAHSTPPPYTPPHPYHRALVLDGGKLTFPLQLRHHRTGERFSPQGMEGSKKVAKFLSDAKIAKHQRQQHPVLVSQGKIVAVVGLRADNSFGASRDSRHIIVVSWEPLEQDTKTF
ncbi:MAG: tRNA lysidine(34) synthetase TilS [Desulfopila sp.]